MPSLDFAKGRLIGELIITYLDSSQLQHSRFGICLSRENEAPRSSGYSRTSIAIKIGYHQIEGKNQQGPQNVAMTNHLVLVQ